MSPGEIADRLAILQVMADYSRHFDGADASAWAALFTPEGTWESLRDDGEGALVRVAHARGHEALRAWAAGRHAERGPGVRVLHHQSTTGFDALDRDEARTRTLVTVTRQSPREPVHVMLAGTYHDVWRRCAPGWRIEHRTLIR